MILIWPIVALIAVALGSGLAAVRPVEVAPQSTVKVLVGTTHCSGVHLGNGVVLTAAHCTEYPVKGIVTDAKREFSASLLWENKAYDVALIHADLEGTALRKSEVSCSAPAVGDQIVISGHPQDLEWIRTRGVVVAPMRDAAFDGIWKEVIVADATAGPGNSGGPVFDLQGQVVGVLVGMYTCMRLSVIVPGSTVCRLLARS